MNKEVIEAEVAAQDLHDGDDIELAGLPQFIVVGGDVAKGGLGTYEVVTVVATVEVVGDVEGRGGIALVLTPEDAKGLAAQLVSVAATLTPMAEQVRRYQDAQELVQSNHPTEEEE